MKYDIEKLQTWYADNCDGEWEHFSGVRIETLDNPGWRVTVDLEGTVSERKEFTTVSIERSCDNWCYCTVKDGKFRGAGGPKNLSEILEIFQKWA